VIPRYDYFVPVWQLAEPIIEVDNCLHALGEHGEIACMNENVPSRNLYLAMKLMSVDARLGCQYRIHNCPEGLSLESRIKRSRG